MKGKKKKNSRIQYKEGLRRILESVNVSKILEDNSQGNQKCKRKGKRCCESFVRLY